MSFLKTKLKSTWWNGVTEQPPEIPSLCILYPGGDNRPWRCQDSWGWTLALARLNQGSLSDGNKQSNKDVCDPISPRWLLFPANCGFNNWAIVCGCCGDSTRGNIHSPGWPWPPDHWWAAPASPDTRGPATWHSRDWPWPWWWPRTDLVSEPGQGPQQPSVPHGPGVGSDQAAQHPGATLHLAADITPLSAGGAGERARGVRRTLIPGMRVMSRSWQGTELVSEKLPTHSFLLTCSRR